MVSATGKPDSSSDNDLREVKCLKCGTINRLPPYQIQEVPRCQQCKHRLPEPITTQAIRFVLANPLIWSALGASLIVAGVTFMDHYSPGPGLIWNAINGVTGGIPTRYFVTAGAALFFPGVALAVKK
jgi:hypothetical protein